jgi:uncharacterized protein (DUF2336 family)
MTAASLIPELEDVIQHGSYRRRAETLRRVAGLFIESAEHYSPEHVNLFDDVLTRLVTEIETKVRAELSERMAPISNAPLGLVRNLAHDDDITVAGPVLRQSVRLQQADLVDVARNKSQAHLQAISGRTDIDVEVTDLLIERGNEDVVRCVAGNRNARLSERSFVTLVRRSNDDDELAERIGLRPDIPPHLFRDLLLRATAVVQQRLLASAKPETRNEIQRVLDRISDEVGRSVPQRDYSTAQRKVLELYQAGNLGESELAEFAKTKQFEETVAALSVMCGVPIETADRLVSGDRADPVLILCRAAGFGWNTARAIVLARPSMKGTSEQALDDAFGNFERLSPVTAQRVVRFWQVRQPDDAA